MGVSFGSLIPKHEIEMKDLSGKILAVDALNTLFQFLTIIRQPDGTPLRDSKGNVTSHLSGILYRNANLYEAGIRVIYVFDGRPPTFKERTQSERRELRAVAAQKYEDAVKAGDIAEARKQATLATNLGDSDLRTAKNLLHALGIPIIEAPSEAEAQASYMAKKKIVYAVASQDMDSVVFGAPILIKNLNVTGKRKIPKKQTYVEIKPEMIKLDEVLQTLGISQEQLAIMSMLIGNDYCDGIQGIGPKKALDLVKRYPAFKDALAITGWPYDTDPEKIYNFMLNPPVRDADVQWHQPDFEQAKKILCDEHEFSEERVDKALQRFRDSQKVQQSSLGRFLKK
jgi:flap endonuclease-1